MTLVDSSVWVDHFRRGNRALRRLLEEGEAATHPLVLGELACGNLARRAETLHLLAQLPQVPEVPGFIVLAGIESQRLWGQGIGWIDANLLLASRISGVRLWTLDRRLASLTSK